MPYIDAQARRDYAAGADPDTPGELNYAVTLWFDTYIGRPLSYERINKAIGLLALLAMIRTNGNPPHNAMPADLEALDEMLHKSGTVRYMQRHPGHAAEILGVFECVKLELYRRLAAPYEDDKCAENGDVYEPTA